MKNIKILLILTIVISLSHMVLAFYSFIKDGLIESLYNSINTDTIPLILFLLVVFLSLLFTSLLIVHGLWQILKKGFFNLRSPLSFKIAGILIIFIGLIAINGQFNIASGHSFSSILNSEVIAEIIQKSYLIIMGYGLIVIAGILKKGAALRQENELTI